MIIHSSYFLPMIGLSFLAVLIFANSRLTNETIAWMQKEEELLSQKRYFHYGLLIITRLLCITIFFTSGKEINETIKCWRENGKIIF